MEIKREELAVEGFEPVYKGVPPFMKFENGFGYMGVLLEEKETGKLQCHLCGHLSLNISKHLFHKHKDVTPTRYKELTGLNRTTPLMSTRTRRFIKNNFLNLTEEKRKEVLKRLKENNKKTHTDGSWKKREAGAALEFNNRFGTCPEQAKTLFWEEYHKLGRIPNNKEMSGKLRHIIYSRFPSYKSALIAWGVTEDDYRSHVIEGRSKAVEARAEKDFFPKYSKEDVERSYGDFFFQHKRLPTWNEVKELGLPGRAPFNKAFGEKTKTEVESMFSVRTLSLS